MGMGAVTVTVTIQAQAQAQARGRGRALPGEEFPGTCLLCTVDSESRDGQAETRGSGRTDMDMLAGNGQRTGASAGGIVIIKCMEQEWKVILCI